MPQLASQLGPQHTQPRSSRGFSLKEGENNLDDPSHKLVINLSSTPLTQAQSSLPAKGPNYAIAPWHPPNLEYITAKESVYMKLKSSGGGGNVGICKHNPKGLPSPKSNLSKAEAQE